MYDAIVIGLGAHGSSCVAHLAKRNAKVLGLERYDRAHALGSSHGHSRAIRLAYFEDPRYVPLVQRSFELFRDLESSDPVSSSPLLTMTGALCIGPEDGLIVQGTLRSAKEHHLDHHFYSTEELRSNYTQFHLGNESAEVAVHESEAGYLNPEACILAHLRLAEAHGAELHFQEEVISWEVAGEGRVSGEERMVRVSTAKGEYQCRRLVLSVGAWAPEIYGRDLQLPFTIERRVLFWLEPDDLTPFTKEEGFPIFIWDFTDEHGNNSSVYGFPHQPGEPGGVKVALHVSSTTPCTPSTIRRDVSPEEVQQDCLCRVVVANMNSLVCFHPKYSAEVVLVSPCSGHGFKFSSVIGEVVADLVQTGTTRHDISLFSLNRERWNKRN